jgi:ubiquinone/menaquinone biosynthesis C-methylase UbiE
MKRCLICNANYASSSNKCTACGFEPEFINGFAAYSPAFSEGGGGFKSSYFKDLAELEEANFWFKSRNQLILWALKKYCPNFHSFLEVGCGTGFVLSGVSSSFPSAELTGSEIFIEGLGFASKRLPSKKFIQMDARDIPFKNEFDVVGAFDVLEHIEEDESVLKQVYRALKVEGYMVLTVPQHKWLWSSTDEYACHVRRYTAAEIHTKLNAAGFNIVRSTSFVSTLLPAMMLSRLSQNKISEGKFDSSSELNITPWLNSLFLTLLAGELKLISNGLNLPFGGTRLVVAKKRG